MVREPYGYPFHCKRGFFQRDEHHDQLMRLEGAVAYNTSLICHLSIMGSSNIKLHRIKFELVLALRQKALQTMNFQQPFCEKENEEEHMLRDVIFLGIMNNIGVLKYEIEDYQHAKNCFEALKQWYFDECMVSRRAKNCSSSIYQSPVRCNYTLFKHARNHENSKESSHMDSTIQFHCFKFTVS